MGWRWLRTLYQPTMFREIIISSILCVINEKIIRGIGDKMMSLIPFHCPILVLSTPL
jgi:hypothetical protein